MKNETRLYRFYNLSKDQYGGNWAMCDKHFKDYKSPDGCIIDKIADKAVEECWKCSETP